MTDSSGGGRGDPGAERTAVNLPAADTGLIFLIGFMASGKSTVGRILARARGWDFCDLDQAITAAAGRSVPQLFADEGEAGFRARERGALQDIARSRRMVVATGGGAACTEENLALMLASGRVFALAVPPAEAVRRAGTQSGRPLLAIGPAAGPSERAVPADALAGVSTLLAAREPFYARAHHRIETSGKSPDEVAAEVLRLLEANPT